MGVPTAAVPWISSISSAVMCQGFDYACKAVLYAVGNDERSSVEFFEAWAAAAGRVITDENARRKASNIISFTLK